MSMSSFRLKNHEKQSTQPMSRNKGERNESELMTMRERERESEDISLNENFKCQRIKKILKVFQEKVDGRG